ncbi:uncharacterized protein [Rutidosis leptorrhynchoides]|uniref:uncharacterized protein n=1 Tax=Rutidosis leptorrhynchoides TaxID=125765 RepID=UPI003A9A0BBC
MRCKKHNTDLSSIVGVCASCLTERLSKLILAQELANANSVNQQIDANSDHQQQRPYNNSKPRLHHSLSDQRFYNSPQIAINTGSCIGNTSIKKKQNLVRFSSFSNLFRSSNRNGDAEPMTSSPVDDRQKNKAFYVDETSTVAGVVPKQRCVRNRGMSPVNSDGGDAEFSDGSTELGSSVMESCKQTPQQTPSRQTVRRGGSRSVSEMIFCLSPLVRPSPNRLWSMKGKPPVDGGDGRSPAAPHLAYTKSFVANRSRKLADFGRCDRNR